MKEYGTIKNFNHDRGFGFVTILGTYRDVFVHITNVKGGSVNEGDKVSFDTKETSKGVNAINVSIDADGYDNRKAKLKEETEELTRVANKEAQEVVNAEVYRIKSLCDKIISEESEILDTDADGLVSTGDYDLMEDFRSQVTSVIDEIRNACKESDEFWINISMDADLSKVKGISINDWDEYEVSKPLGVNEFISKLESLRAPVLEYLLKRDEEISELKKKEEKASLKSEMESLLDGRSVVELGKKEFKAYVRLIVKYEDRNWSDSMDEDNYMIISAIINNGEHNVGYFQPSGGRTRRAGDSYARTRNNFKISGGKCFTIAKWLSRNRNWCSDLQHYRIQGSIDDSFEAIIDSLTAE